jgi:NCAIR mutase (PurE)-related protein
MVSSKSPKKAAVKPRSVSPAWRWLSSVGLISRAVGQTYGLQPGEHTLRIVTAGTADQRVADEAVATLEFLGVEALRIEDVGVAGLHRLLANVPKIRGSAAAIVVAGMEGALPSVVGGLVDFPVIAVPTSVGYGASYGGLAALLAMMNSCAAGVTVVNIDNGFGAAVAATMILRTAARFAPP